MSTLLFIALISDIKTYRIKNVIVYPYIIAGIVTNTALYGLNGFGASLSGTLVPVLLLIFLYILRMLGAGDIKLFGAIGAIMGVEFALFTIAYSFLAGGIIAIVLILIRKNSTERLSHFFSYIKNSIISLSFLPYTDFENKHDKAKFHFAYAIVFGAIIRIIEVSKIF